jgi:hypothetical protein
MFSLGLRRTASTLEGASHAPPSKNEPNRRIIDAFSLDRFVLTTGCLHRAGPGWSQSIGVWGQQGGVFFSSGGALSPAEIQEFADEFAALDTDVAALASGLADLRLGSCLDTRS